VRAAYYVRAVFAALKEGLSAVQMERLRNSLPEMFEPIFESFSGETVEPMPPNDRAQQIAETARSERQDM
jgi:hypothetical protein